MLGWGPATRIYLAAKEDMSSRMAAVSGTRQRRSRPRGLSGANNDTAGGIWSATQSYTGAMKRVVLVLLFGALALQAQPSVRQALPPGQSTLRPSSLVVCVGDAPAPCGRPGELFRGIK